MICMNSNRVKEMIKIEMRIAILLGITLVLPNSISTAGPLPQESLIDFSNGTVTNAIDVNTNFENIETEVTDNANDINNNITEINTIKSQVPGINFVESGSLPTVGIISGAFTMVSNITVTTPASGFLIATAYGRHNCTVSSDFVRVEFLNATTTESSIEYFDDPASSGGFRPISFSSHFAVSAGVNNIEFRARCDSGTGTVNMRSFYVMYLPKRYQ